MSDAAQVCFVGGGDSVASVLGSPGAAELWEAGRIWIAGPNEDDRAQLIEANCQVVDTAAQLPRSPLVFLCCKAPDLEAACAQLRAGEALADRPVVVSAIAGVTTATLKRLTGTIRLVRLLPPAGHGVGLTCTYAHTTLHTDQSRECDAIEQIFRRTGLFEWVEDEARLDILTAFGGAAVAGSFKMAATFAAAAQRQGLAEHDAIVAAIHVMTGSPALLMRHRDDPATMRAQTLARGGTAAAALAMLDQTGFAQAVADRMQAALPPAGEDGRDPPGEPDGA